MKKGLVFLVFVLMFSIFSSTLAAADTGTDSTVVVYGAPVCYHESVRYVWDHQEVRTKYFIQDGWYWAYDYIVHYERIICQICGQTIGWHTVEDAGYNYRKISPVV